MSDVLLIPVTAVQPDLVTQTDQVIYVPLASKNAHGIVKIGEGLDITPDGLLSFDRSEVTIKEIALNGTLLVPDENKRINIVLHKKDVGLDNVDNTSDLDKPISTATQTALDELDTNLTDDILDVDDRLIDHINDFGNPHRVTKTQVGLSDVDNTSDLDKPISRATQRELSRIQGLIKGGETAVSYESYEEMITDLNILDSDVYNVGQSIYIKTLRVPDLWVYAIEDEFEEFVYIDDSTIESILKIDGTFKVGYYRLAALDTLKVDLSNYVTLDGVQSISGDKDFTGLLTLNNVRIATEEDLPKEYIKNVVVDDDTTLVLTTHENNQIRFNVDLSGYLPLSAGNKKHITGKLYVDNDIVLPNNVHYRSVTSEGKEITLFRLAASNSIMIGDSSGNYDMATYSLFRPVSGAKKAALGSSTYKWNSIHGVEIYQNDKPVANVEDLSAVTDATLSSDSKILTITKRDGSSFNFQGGGGGGGGVPKATCSTSSSTATKIVDLDGFVVEKGAMIDVTFTYSNGSGLPKLNINSTGAKSIQYYEIGINGNSTLLASAGGGDTSIPYGGWRAGDTIRFFYDGTYWIEVMNISTGTQYAIPYRASRADVATSASTSTTRATTDNSTNIATTAFVKSVLPEFSLDGTTLTITI